MGVSRLPVLPAGTGRGRACWERKLCYWEQMGGGREERERTGSGAGLMGRAPEDWKTLFPTSGVQSPSQKALDLDVLSRTLQGCKAHLSMDQTYGNQCLLDQS